MRLIETPQDVEQLFYLRDGRTLVAFGRKPASPPKSGKRTKVTLGWQKTLDSVQGWDVTTGAASFVLTHLQHGDITFPGLGLASHREDVGARAILSPRGTFLALHHYSYHSGATLDPPLQGGILLWRVPPNPAGEKDSKRVGCFSVSANWKQQPRHLNIGPPFALSADEQLAASGALGTLRTATDGSSFLAMEVRRFSDNWLLGRLNCLGEARCLCFSLDSQELFLACTGPDTPPQVEFWSVSSLEMIRRVEVPSPGQLLNLLVTPDGNTLIVHTSTRLLLLNRKTGTIRNWLEADPGQTIPSVAVSPDGSRLLLCIGRTVRLLDIPNLRLREAFDWDLRDLRAVAFSPDGMTMAAAGQCRIVVWDCPP